MEIDFTELKIQKRVILILAISLVTMIILGLVGWNVLPDRVLTWTEWQVIQQSLAYQRELRILVRNADRLAELLHEQPDAVRAQLVTERVRREIQQLELSSLTGQKEGLLSATDDVEAWSLGSSERAAAVSALQRANQTIQRAIEVTEYE